MAWVTSIYGLVSGNLYDSYLLSIIGILSKLQEFFPEDTSKDFKAVICSLYGDPPYPKSVYSLRGYTNPSDGSAHVLWNS
jgi:hypothetical protein